MEKSANECMANNTNIAVIGPQYCAPYPIDLAIAKKVLTEHSRWNVFRGESTNDEDFLFTVKTTSIMQFHAKLAVFLANNTSKEKVSDFMIKGSWSDKPCAIYAGDSSTIIAQMHNKIIDQKLVIGKENLTVTICPNIDYAFIAALMVIFGEITATNDALLIAAVIRTGAAVAS
ncbi:hypothetical protein BC332_01708 [Capsicum chinense]|nr:hypothetical protein BC332_01708 [Capsicum chinense]